MNIMKDIKWKHAVEALVKADARGYIVDKHWQLLYMLRDTNSKSIQLINHLSLWTSHYKIVWLFLFKGIQRRMWKENLSCLILEYLIRKLKTALCKWVFVHCMELIVAASLECFSQLQRININIHLFWSNIQYSYILWTSITYTMNWIDTRVYNDTMITYMCVNLHICSCELLITSALYTNNI